MYAQIDRVTTQRASMLLDRIEIGEYVDEREWAYLLEWLKVQTMIHGTKEQSCRTL